MLPERDKREDNALAPEEYEAIKMKALVATPSIFIGLLTVPEESDSAAVQRARCL
jgi:hypothetical protein